MLQGVNSSLVLLFQVKGGTAESDGRLSPGDQILRVNGEDLSHVTHEYAAAFMKVIVSAIFSVFAPDV